MQSLRKVFQLLWVVGAFGAVPAACGGQSFNSTSNGGSSGDGGGDATAGTHSSAGKAGDGTGGTMGGNGASAGTGQGATDSGGSAGSMSTAGAAGATNEACSGPSESGGSMACSAVIPIWTHDPSTGLCRPTFYGGCFGTKNNYKTLEECQNACPGGTPNYDACTAPTDCMLTSPGCCGVCDGPNISTHDFVAFNKQYADKGLTCAGGVACGACPPATGEATLKYFLPNCVQKQCVVEDLRTSAVTACKTDMDCKLRLGTGCCPSCGPGTLVAVRNDGSFEKQVCGNLLPPCAACDVAPDPGVIAMCGASGHCEVAAVSSGAR